MPEAYRKYNVTAPTYADKGLVEPQSDVAGNDKITLATLIAGEDLPNNVLRVRFPATTDATDAWTKFNTAAKVGLAGQVIKASAGRLRQIMAVSANTTTAFFLLVHDKATAPVANDIPTLGAVLIPAATAAGIGPSTIDFGSEAIYAATGLSFAISTTPDKVTFPLTSDVMVWARYA